MDSIGGATPATPTGGAPDVATLDLRSVVQRRLEGERRAGADSASVTEAALITLAKRGANRVIHDLASPSSASEPVGFFCECADPDCRKVVWFAAEVFDRASADRTWYALATGHQASASDSLEAS